ncbi:MAG: hypothetical protein ACXVQ7_01510 [Actinomycetota bacterium]
MATILLIEDEPDLGLYEAKLLEQEGHHVLRCNGAPTPFGACPVMRGEGCPLVGSAEVIIFSCRMFAPLRNRPYTGADLLLAYRSHAAYGDRPMLVVSVGAPDKLPGKGPLISVEKFAAPGSVTEAVHALLDGKARSQASA